MRNIRPCSHNRTFSVEEVIEGGGGFVATNSMLYRTASMTELPEFYYIAPVGDYPMMIYLALKGTVYYIDEFMSVYRQGVKGSYTQRTASDNNLIIRHYISINNMFDELNEYTNYKYNKVINDRTMLNKYNILSIQRN